MLRADVVSYGMVPLLSATSAAARRRHGHDVSFGEAHTGDGSVERRCRGYGMVPLFPSTSQTQNLR